MFDLVFGVWVTSKSNLIDVWLDLRCLSDFKIKFSWCLTWSSVSEWFQNQIYLMFDLVFGVLSDFKIKLNWCLTWSLVSEWLQNQTYLMFDLLRCLSDFKIKLTWCLTWSSLSEWLQNQTYLMFDLVFSVRVTSKPNLIDVWLGLRRLTDFKIKLTWCLIWSSKSDWLQNQTYLMFDLVFGVWLTSKSLVFGVSLTSKSIFPFSYLGIKSIKDLVNKISGEPLELGSWYLAYRMCPRCRWPD